MTTHSMRQAEKAQATDYIYAVMVTWSRHADVYPYISRCFYDKKDAEIYANRHTNSDQELEVETVTLHYDDAEQL